MTQRTARMMIGRAAWCFLLLVLSAPAYAADCTQWNTDEYFSAATAPDVKRCLHGGADPNVRDEEGWAPLHIAAALSADHRVIATLFNFGADPFTLNSGWSPLAVAATYNVNHEVHATLLALHLSDRSAEPGPGSPPFRRAGLHHARCWFEPDRVPPNTQCFFMVVRENPDDAAGDLIAFPVVKFPASKRVSSGNPILHLGGGGPGSSMGLEAWTAGVWSDYRDMVEGSGRDLYVIDPRGVGMAYPKLHCPEYFDSAHSVFSESMQEREEHESHLASYRLCKQRLDEDNRDLSFYNSRSVARDVEHLRHALGVNEWVLFGVSYGSRYALTVARYFPDTVEAMILNGAAFPHLTDAERAAEMTRRAFERAFDWCDRFPSCDGPRLYDRFRNLVASLDADPLMIDDFSWEIANQYGVERLALNGGRLVNILFFAFYDADFAPKLPYVIDALERRQPGLLQEALRIWFGWHFDDTYSDPVSYAHYCAEEHPFSNYELGVKNAQASEAYIRNYLVYFLLHGAKADCGIWDVAAADPVEAEPVVTDIPTLFLQGALDPVTPEDDLLDQLQHFERHAVLTFDDSSHRGSVHGRCAMKAAAHFIRHKALTPGVDYARCGAG